MTYVDASALEVLRSLEERSGKGLVQELLSLYFSSAPTAISNMKENLSTGKYKDLMREAHTLKSSSANLGAMKMMEVCKDLEYSTMDDSRPADSLLNEKILKVESTLGPTLLELKQLLQRAS